MKKTKMQKGITLVALIITIIVLLILAMIAIQAVTGSGIFGHARRAKDEYARTSEEENGILKGYGSYINGQLGIEEDIDEGTSYDGMYNLAGLEGKIAPTDLFDYEPIEGTGQTAALDNSSLPQKEIRITRIKPEYCNGGGYNPETEKYDLANTNYEVIYKGEKLADGLLVIPYQVEYEGELYKITEVDLKALGNYVDSSGVRGSGIVGAETIVFPNTVKKIENNFMEGTFQGIYTTHLKTLVLPEGIVEITGSLCANMEAKYVKLPKSLRSIEAWTFSGCKNLDSIIYQGTQAEWNKIEKNEQWNQNSSISQVVCSDGTITL